MGKKKEPILTRARFRAMMGEFYTQLHWAPDTSEPKVEKLKSLGLAA